MTETIHLPHLPPELSLYITAYTSVQNTPYLRQQLLSANQDFNYAFIDASTILSRRHLLAACFRAMNDHIHDRLRSNNVQSEVVFCLSPNNNIGDAFRRFGIQDGSRDMVVVKVGEGEVDRTKVEEHLNSAVEGERVQLTDDWLGQVCDLGKVRKTYKIAKPTHHGKSRKVVNGDVGDDADDRELVEVQVLGLMALRGAT